MKIIITLLIIIICGIGADAQNDRLPRNINITKPIIVLPETARFQIYTLESDTSGIFKLDRHTGKTYRYNPNGVRWVLLEVRGGLPAAPPNIAPRYQIHDIGYYYPFLINNETGQTWIWNGQR